MKKTVGASTETAKKAERILIRAMLEARPSESGIPIQRWKARKSCNCWACEHVRALRKVFHGR